MSKRKRTKPRGRRGPDVWVVRSGQGFVAREQGGPNALTRETTQAMAIDVGRRRAQRNRSELIVQAGGGRIRIKNS